MTTPAENAQRIRAVAAEHALAESEALNRELHEQLDRANRAAVRMARAASRVMGRRAA